jgi:hypothetical protein
MTAPRSAATLARPLLSLEQKGAVGLHFAGVYGVENSAVSASTIKALLKGTLVSVSSGVREAVQEAVDGFHNPDELAERSGFDPAFLGAGFETPAEIASGACQWPREALRRNEGTST